MGRHRPQGCFRPSSAQGRPEETGPGREHARPRTGVCTEHTFHPPHGHQPRPAGAPAPDAPGAGRTATLSLPALLLTPASPGPHPQLRRRVPPGPAGHDPTQPSTPLEHSQATCVLGTPRPSHPPPPPTPRWPPRPQPPPPTRLSCPPTSPGRMAHWAGGGGGGVHPCGPSWTDGHPGTPRGLFHWA